MDDPPKEDIWADHARYQRRFPAFEFGVFSDRFGLTAEEFEQFFRQIHSEIFESVLDFGCGSGLYRAWFPDALYLGLDGSTAMLEAARERWPQDRFLLYEAGPFPVASHSLDLIITTAVLQHIHDTDKEKLLPEFRRVLRKGRRFLIWEETFGAHRLGVPRGYGRTTEGWKDLAEQFGFRREWTEGDQHAFRAV